MFLLFVFCFCFFSNLEGSHIPASWVVRAGCVPVAGIYLVYLLPEAINQCRTVAMKDDWRVWWQRGFSDFSVGSDKAVGFIILGATVQVRSVLCSFLCRNCYLVLDHSRETKANVKQGKPTSLHVEDCLSAEKNGTVVWKRPMPDVDVSPCSFPVEEPGAQQSITLIAR